MLSSLDFCEILLLAHRISFLKISDVDGHFSIAGLHLTVLIYFSGLELFTVM